MKYGIPLVDGQLSQHFGQSTAFMIIDAENGKVNSKEVMSIAAHSCGALSQSMREKGVKVVITGGMGYAPRMSFEQSGIKVVLGVTETDPEKAVLAYMDSTLVSGQNVCDHGDEPCEHHEEHHGGQH
jgi:predicted Fe-Mo cluster-binding NifX family protein